MKDTNKVLNRWDIHIPIIILVLSILLSIPIYAMFWDFDTSEGDIYYIYLEGKHILAGENPYERILAGNMQVNQKYSTYFPLFYWLSALSQMLGLKDFRNWVHFWRIIFLFFSMGIGILSFNILFQRKLPWVAVFGCVFWLFNRWTLHVAQIAHIDFIPLFIVMLSLFTFSKNKWLSLFLLGLSLAIKQIAVFMIPLYLIWIWQSQEANSNKLKQIIYAIICIFCIPFLVSLPFLFWNPEGFVKSILFSLTRNPESHFYVLSLDGILGWSGILARMPMLTLMLLIYFCAFQRKIGVYTSVLFCIAVFLDFNSVLFSQYMCWLTPFLLLSITDWIPKNKKDNLLLSVQ